MKPFNFNMILNETDNEHSKKGERERGQEGRREEGREEGRKEGREGGREGGIPLYKNTLLIKTACAVPNIRIVYILTPEMRTPLY